MKLGKLLKPRQKENLKLAVIVILFLSMLFLFFRFLDEKMGLGNNLGFNSKNTLPADKLWVLTGDSFRSYMAETESPYIFPTSITFRNNEKTYSALKQKSTIVALYNDFTPYISQILGPYYIAKQVDYNEYTSVVTDLSSDYTLFTYDTDIPAYVLRIYCDRLSGGFYEGEACNIKKILIFLGKNNKPYAYTVDSNNGTMLFSPLESYLDKIPDYTVTDGAVMSYNSNKVLVPSQMSFESEYFSDLQHEIAPDIVLTHNMQFYETGIINSLNFIGNLSQEEDIFKNDKIISILKSFEINTSLVRQYTEDNVINFIENNAVLKLSKDGYITYSGENGGIPLSRILNSYSDTFSFTDKLNAATTLMNNFSKDIICGSGNLMLSAINYQKDTDILNFEFTYTFDSVPFPELDKIRLSIGKNSIFSARIPTYSLYRYSTRKSQTISPEISHSITNISDNTFISDYKPAYILSSKGNTATVSWIAVSSADSEANPG